VKVTESWSLKIIFFYSVIAAWKCEYAIFRDFLNKFYLGSSRHRLSREVNESWIEYQQFFEHFVRYCRRLLALQCKPTNCFDRNWRRTGKN
jgi:hypothetical protein